MGHELTLDRHEAATWEYWNYNVGILSCNVGILNRKSGNTKPEMWGNMYIMYIIVIASP